MLYLEGNIYVLVYFSTPQQVSKLKVVVLKTYMRRVHNTADFTHCLSA